MKALKITVEYLDRTITLNSGDADKVMKEIGAQVLGLPWKVKLKAIKKHNRGESPWKNSPKPMNCNDFVEKMLKSPQRHVQIIGHLADEMKPGLATKGQWQVFFDRYKKEASLLVPFTDEQLDYGCRKAIMNHPDIWTLETIKKEILKRKDGEK